jgi:hypothetical protein
LVIRGCGRSCQPELDALNAVNSAVTDALLEVKLGADRFLADPCDVTVERAVATLHEARAVVEQGPAAVDELLLSMQVFNVLIDDESLAGLHERRRLFLREREFIDMQLGTFATWSTAAGHP